MAIFFYTDADRTQIVTMNPATADGITLSSSDTGDLKSTKITFDGLGDLYFSTKYDSSIFWARSIKFTNASIFDAETISDLYTPDGFRIHIGVTKTGEGVYSLSGAFAVYKPDGTTWKNGQKTTVRITDAESDKKLRIILCQLTYTLYGGGTIHGYYLMPGWVRITQALPPEILYIMSGNGVWFNDAFFSKSETDPQGGIPQEPEGGDGSHSLTGGALDTGTAAGRSSDMGGGGINTGAHGTHVYEITGAAFDSFMQTIYGQGSSTFEALWQQFKNFNHDPLSGILSAFIIPISAPGSLVTAVTLSGQQIAISGGTCKAISQRFTETAETTIPIPGYHNSFLDYAPYTKVSLYLPFVGTVSVNTNECMRGIISIKYWVDVCTGECVAYVDLVDWNGYHTYYNYSGNCAAFIPVSANDAGISSIISGGASVIGGIASLATGGIMGGGLGGIVSGIADLAVPQTHEKNTGGFSGGAGALGILFPFVVINRPSSAIPAGFTKAIGGASVQTGTVGSYSGFTSFSIVRLDGIQATEAEKREIERLLMSGVYL